MATGASNSDAAVILIDARKGVLTQTRRHSYICSLLGIRHVAVAVNKIDLVEFSGERFHHIMGDYFGFAQALGFASITPIPLSARYRRERQLALGQDALVRRSDAARIPRERRGGSGAGTEAVPLPGAVGESPEPGFPGVLRHGGLGHDQPGRQDRRCRLLAKSPSSRASSRLMAICPRHALAMPSP